MSASHVTDTALNLWKACSCGPPPRTCLCSPNQPRLLHPRKRDRFFSASSRAPFLQNVGHSIAVLFTCAWFFIKRVRRKKHQIHCKYQGLLSLFDCEHVAIFEVNFGQTGLFVVTHKSHAFSIRLRLLMPQNLTFNFRPVRLVATSRPPIALGCYRPEVVIRGGQLTA